MQEGGLTYQHPTEVEQLLPSNRKVKQGVDLDEKLLPDSNLVVEIYRLNTRQTSICQPFRHFSPKHEFVKNVKKQSNHALPVKKHHP